MIDFVNRERRYVDKIGVVCYNGRMGSALATLVDAKDLSRTLTLSNLERRYTKMYQNMNYYLYSEDMDLREAFIAGALSMLQVHKIAIPVSGGIGEVEAWVETTLVAYQVEVERQIRARVNKIIDKYGYDKGALRGMLLDTARVSKAGVELDGDDIPLSDNFGNTLPGATHHEWPDFYWCDSSGARMGGIGASDEHMYKRGCHKVRFMSIYHDGEVVYHLRSDDTIAVKVFLERDMMAGEQINSRYSYECQAGCLLEGYADTVRKMGGAMHDAVMKTAQKMAGDRPEEVSEPTGPSWRMDSEDICVLLVFWNSYHLKIENDDMAEKRLSMIRRRQDKPRTTDPEWRASLPEDLEFTFALVDYVLTSQNVELNAVDKEQMRRIEARLRAERRLKSYIPRHTVQCP